MAFCLWYVNYVFSPHVQIEGTRHVVVCNLVTPVVIDATFIRPFSHGSNSWVSQSRCESYACVARAAQQVSHLAVLPFLLPLPCIVGCDCSVKCIALFSQFSFFSFPSHFRHVLRQRPTFFRLSRCSQVELRASLRLFGELLETAAVEGWMAEFIFCKWIAGGVKLLPCALLKLCPHHHPLLQVLKLTVVSEKHVISIYWIMFIYRAELYPVCTAFVICSSVQTSNITFYVSLPVLRRQDVWVWGQW